MSEAEIQKLVKAGKIRTRGHGARGVLLHPEDLEREFGFAQVSLPATRPMNPRVVKLLRDLRR